MKTNRKVNLTVDSETIQSSRLDKWIMDQFKINKISITRSYLIQLIELGSVLVNGKMAKASYQVRNHDSIEIEIPTTQKTNLVATAIPLDIVYEDQDIIVVDKPSGLVVHPSAGHESDTLVNALLYHTRDLSMKNEERPGIVHRIDKETSGLLVIAKNDFAHEKLAQQFKDKTSHRIYFAIAEGQFKRPQGAITSYLARHPQDRKRQASIRKNNKIVDQYEGDFENGKWAVTHYKVIETVGTKSLVQLKLETGRTHQIRVHLSELGHPLFGDVVYGYPKIKYKKLDLKRFYLHAAELGFIHPRTEEKMLFKSEWPKVDQTHLKELGFKNV